jgi:hypothetical protein
VTGKRISLLISSEILSLGAVADAKARTHFTLVFFSFPLGNHFLKGGVCMSSKFSRAYSKLLLSHLCNALICYVPFSRCNIFCVCHVANERVLGTKESRKALAVFVA